jgi:hypothetical protein
MVVIVSVVTALSQLTTSQKVASLMKKIKKLLGMELLAKETIGLPTT